MIWILLLTSLIALSLCIAGAFVFLANRTSAVNRSFSLFTGLLAVWMLANFIGANFKTHEFARVFIYIDFILGPIMIYLFWNFTYILYCEARKRIPRFNTERAVLLGVAVVCSMLPISSAFVMFTWVNSVWVLNYGVLYDVYSACIGIFAVYGIANLVRARKHAYGVMKRQLSAMLLALTVAVTTVAASNVIIPHLTDSKSFNLFAGNTSYLGILFFVGVTMYATIKHKMFNVRFIVARSVAYLLLITTLVGLYSALIFGLASQFISEDYTIGQQLVPMLAALFVAATASSFKRLFDRLTNQIFYRDSYDPEVFLNQLNKTIVSNIEIGILLRHTSQVIEENLKAECHIYVRETDTNASRTMGVSRKNLVSDDISLIKSELSTIQDKTVLTDSLERHYVKLKDTLDKNNIAVISRLMTSYATNQEAAAYLMLGPKKSGDVYSKQDLRIIDIITDELLIAIQNALRFEEIQTFNITLQNRINDATSKLKRSNEKLKEMDETKDEFISMASHQLRTPLTSVKGYLSMVLDGDAGKVTDSQQQLLNQAYVSSQRMVYLIADLLNVSRLKTGKFIIDRTSTNLADIVEGEIAQLREVAKGRKLTLTYDKPEDFPILELDETKTRQVIMNFVDNAIYYTPAGGKIKIELRADRSSVYFMVKDNGLGVPKSEQSHLFAKFYRAKNAQKARPDGTGLGLFMAKKVITDQGGTILFESTEGKGSTFGFKFDRPKNAKDKD